MMYDSTIRRGTNVSLVDRQQSAALLENAGEKNDKDSDKGLMQNTEIQSMI